MKSTNAMLVAALAMAAIGGTAKAAVSLTQQWHVVGEQVQNTSNGQTLCMTGEYYEQATMQVCGSAPAVQNIRRVNFDLNRVLRLDSDPSMYFTVLSSEVFLIDQDGATFNQWSYNNLQLEFKGSEKCLDIQGGKNVPGALLILTTCTH